jgi:hypothetical protein
VESEETAVTTQQTVKHIPAVTLLDNRHLRKEVPAVTLLHNRHLRKHVPAVTLLHNRYLRKHVPAVTLLHNRHLRKYVPAVTLLHNRHLRKHVPAVTNIHTKVEELLDAVFSMQSVPRPALNFYLNKSRPCGGGFEYLHCNPASRKRRRKENSVPGL